MKYKVGQKVKIRSLEWYRDNVNRYGIIECGKYEFFEPMNEYCGKVVTIKRIDDDNYRIDADKGAFCWTDEMIEELVAFTDETLVERARELFSEPQEKKMKYKPGDRVKLIEESEEIVYRSPFGDITLDKRSLRWLCGWFGQEVTLDSAHNGLYTAIEIKGYYLAEEMIEGLADVPAIYPEADGWVNEFACPDGYIFKDENGNVINATKIVLEKKKKEYPKTFEECVHVLEGEIRTSLEQMNTLRKLIDARNAYWKIAGEEMELGKPWEPDYDSGADKFGIICLDGVVQESNPTTNWERHLNKILDFPTKEMRDAFKQNFDPDIEICKEFL